MPYVYVDIEGKPLRELGAIYCSDSFDITDTFLAYSDCHHQRSDWYGQRYIHGLPPRLPMTLPNVYPNEAAVVAAFKEWLSTKPDNITLYANNPDLERQTLDLPVQDLPLLPWAERFLHPSHYFALICKERAIAMYGNSCAAHTNYRGWIPRRSPPSPSDIARSLSGAHCALYDAYELCVYHKLITES